MSISRNLADVLHRFNDLLPHREESAKLELRDAIESEAPKEEDSEEAKADAGEGGETE